MFIRSHQTLTQWRTGRCQGGTEWVRQKKDGGSASETETTFPWQLPCCRSLTPCPEQQTPTRRPASPEPSTGPLPSGRQVRQTRTKSRRLPYSHRRSSPGSQLVVNLSLELSLQLQQTITLEPSGLKDQLPVGTEREVYTQALKLSCDSKSSALWLPCD